MSRKHFQAIAHALKINEPNVNSEYYEREAELFRNIVLAIGGVCKSFNSRFNCVRFERAAGLESLRNP
jgi:hypothetical protein